MTDSPDLGPPPMSRFVEPDPVKVDSPTRLTSEAVPVSENITAATSPKQLVPPQSTELKTSGSEPEKSQQAFVSKATKSLTTVSATPAPKAGSKRKFGASDENDVPNRGSVQGEKPRLIKSSSEPVMQRRELKAKKSFKEIPGSQKDAKDKPMVIGQNAVRRPLASRSTNEDVASPRKTVKPLLKEEHATELPLSIREKLVKSKTKKEAKPLSIEIPPELQPAVVDVTPEAAPKTPFIEQQPTGSESPDRTAPRAELHDTPPPADISARGETSRASRRARGSVSYAEPSLRAKMRRPTEQLFDAVAGEGKYIQQHKADNTTTAAPSSSKVKVEGDTSTDWKNLPAAEAITKGAARATSVPSHLAQKETLPERLPSSVATARRKRMSSIGAQDTIEASLAVDKEDCVERFPKTEDSPDPYDFTASSLDISGSSHSPSDAKDNPIVVRGSKTSRRSSTHLKEGAVSRATKAPPSQKRASMVALKKSSMLEEDDDDDSYEPSAPNKSERGDDELSAKDRISRRRSMML